MAKQPWKTLSFPAGNGTQLQISVWKNEVKGEEYVTYCVTVQRRYRQGDEWKGTNSLRPQDLLVAAHGLQQAYQLLIDEKSKK